MSRLDTLLAPLNFKANYDEDGILKSVEIDGEEFPAINGEITQTILSIGIRLKERADEIKKAKEEVYSAILAAVNKGIVHRDGARRPTKKVTKTTSRSYQKMLVEVMTDAGKDEKEIEAYVETKTKRGVSTSIVIEAVK